MAAHKADYTTLVTDPAKAFVSAMIEPRATVVGEHWKRVPAPYAADHPREELLRHAGFQVRWPEPVPASISDASFVDWCVEQLARVAPIHLWLRDQMG